MAHQLPPAGWYPDPTSSSTQRYWNGQAWTRDTQPDPASVFPNASDEGPTIVKSLPPSEWSRQQWTHVLVALGVPLVLLAGLVVLLVDTSGDVGQESTATTTAEQPGKTPTTNRETDTPLTTAATTTSLLGSLSTTSTEAVDPTRVGAGTYAVGSEIAPGVYRVSIHWARLDENMDVIDNDLTITGVSIMTVLASDSFIELSGTALPIELVPTLDPIESGFNQGTYLVGPDIEPGTYEVRAESGATAYAARLTEDLTVIEAEQNDRTVSVHVTLGDFALRYTGTLERVD